MDRREHWLAAAAAAVSCWASESAAQAPALDMRMNTINGLVQVGQRLEEAGDPAPAVVGTRIVGLTFNVPLENVGNVGVPWNFPVYEMWQDAAHPAPAMSPNPWIRAFGNYTGVEGAFNHPHTHRFDMAPPNLPPPNDHHPQAVVGPGGGHPHYTFYVFRKPAPAVGDPPFTTTIIGRSDLKHAYLSGPPPLHTNMPGITDVYSAAHNQDQNFFGPISEMNATPGPLFATVARHDHMGSEYAGLDQPGVGAPALHRDHGELNRAGEPDPANPGMMRLRAVGDGLLPAIPAQGPEDHFRDHSAPDCIDHLLQVGDMDLNPAMNPGARYFLGAAAWVAGDVNMWNNFMWREITPVRGGGANTPAYTFLLGGMMSLGVQTVPMFDQTMDPLLQYLVPTPGAGALLGLFALGALRRRRRGD